MADSKSCLEEASLNVESGSSNVVEGNASADMRSCQGAALEGVQNSDLTPEAHADEFGSETTKAAQSSSVLVDEDPIDSSQPMEVDKCESSCIEAPAAAQKEDYGPMKDIQSVRLGNSGPSQVPDDHSEKLDASGPNHKEPLADVKDSGSKNLTDGSEPMELIEFGPNHSQGVAPVRIMTSDASSSDLDDAGPSYKAVPAAAPSDESDSTKDTQSVDSDDSGPSHRGVLLASLNSDLIVSLPCPRRDFVYVDWPNKGNTRRFLPHDSGHIKWDFDHVRMPFSRQNQIVTGRPKKLESRWNLIQGAFTPPPKTAEGLEFGILSYQKSRKKLKGLVSYLEELEEMESDSFFCNILPDMIKLCLDLPNNIKTSIPLMEKYRNKRFTFSQYQIASLLANAFFCTFPRRNFTYGNKEYPTYPGMNFLPLFGEMDVPYQAEKFKCLLNYFRIMTKRISENEPETLVTYERRFLSKKELPKWECSQHNFDDLHIDSKGLIEGAGMLEIDFANAFIGGGVLGHGCVQEEIRKYIRSYIGFLLSPELILSRLFAEKMQENECIIITGFEQFSKYTGYAKTFKFKGIHQDERPILPDSQHRKSRLVAIDAINFKDPEDQYEKDAIVRELNKAYVGFHSSRDEPNVAVATGNWGCGAFGGDPELKSLLQLMAASQNSRGMAYFTFGSNRFRNNLFSMYRLLKEKDVSVGCLYTHLLSYKTRKDKRQSVFKFLTELLEHS